VSGCGGEDRALSLVWTEPQTVGIPAHRRNSDSVNRTLVTYQMTRIECHPTSADVRVIPLYNNFLFSLGPTEFCDELTVFVNMKFLVCTPWWRVVEWRYSVSDS
jgi:hypothetical protein